MTYDAVTYWTEASVNPDHQDHEARFVRTSAFIVQEQELLLTLERLDFDSILEFGCGWGRITKLVHDRWPDIPYRAVDLSEERLRSAALRARDVEFQRSTIAEYDGVGADLVLSVEVLMHQRPEDIAAATRKLIDLAKRYVVTLDWTEPIDRPAASHNFRHDYAALYGDRLLSVERIGLQSIFVATP